MPAVFLPPRPIQRLTRPVQRFLEVESASGIVLAVGTVAALALANSPAAGWFHNLWEFPLRVGAGPFALDEPLHFWINDALMALFFFVVGLEIKREIAAGELSSPRTAALPVIAALGGMIVPAGVYLAFQYGRPGERGWAIPMATDIAFVVGVLAVFGKRVPPGLKVFLLSLAIADDVGAILVIAAVYSGSPDWTAMATAGFWLGVVYALNRLGVRAIAVYVVVGAAVWLAVLKSGIHPTIAGVALGLLTPTGAWVGRTALRLAAGDLATKLQSDETEEIKPHDLQLLRFAARESVSPVERLELVLHPWVAFVVMPVFALANAGVAVNANAFTDPVAVAVACGLVLGKPVGIVGFSYLAVRLGLARRPTGVNWKHLTAAGCLGGIGFTMSLFVAGLAFPPPGPHLDAAKVGILLGSLVSAVLGSGLLVVALRKKKTEGSSPTGTRS